MIMFNETNAFVFDQHEWHAQVSLDYNSCWIGMAPAGDTLAVASWMHF